MTKDGIDIQCAAGPPCTYLTIGNVWGCSFDGLCQYQRPLITLVTPTIDSRGTEE